MKKLVFGLIIVLAFVSFSPHVEAQGVGEQNVVLSCLEPTNKDVSVKGGVLNDFTTGLADNKSIFNEENGPVYVLISYPVPGFKPKDSKFSDTCEHRHDSNAEGQYWFCADLKGGASQCAPSMLKPNTEVMRPADAPRQPANKEEGSCLKTVFQIEGAAFENGQFKVGSAKMYTLLHNSVKFWGLQFTKSGDGLDSEVPSTEEISHALKLASFTNDTTNGVPIPANSNCTAISWDPYGRVIDSRTLEPVPDTKVSLKQANTKNVLELSRNPENPVFRNPFYTNSQGGFNFAVKPGTYYLTVEHPDFSFPAVPSFLEQALANLNLFDPREEYIERTKANGKVYQNSQEAIIEEPGIVERRDIIMDPKDSNYQGWTPELISVQNSRQGIKQLVSGIVSHPQSLIHVFVANTEVTQTRANMDGEFSVLLPEGRIQNEAEEFSLTVEKVPLVKGIGALTSTKKPFRLIPAALSGFIFDADLKVVPNAKVDLVISSFGAFPYTTFFADENGFISLPHQTLPVEEFYLQVQPPPSNQAPSYKLTIADFKRLNRIYLQETGVNLYNPTVATESLANPGAAVIAKVKAETPLALKNQNPFAKPPAPTLVLHTPPPIADEGVNWLVFVSLLLASVLLLVAFFIKRKRQTPFESSALDK